MAITFINPFMEKMQEKMKILDSEKDENKKSEIENEIEELRKKSKQFAIDKVKSLGIRLEKAKEIKSKVETSDKQNPEEIKNLIEEVKIGYKEALALHFEYRSLKKHLKELIGEKDDGKEEETKS